MNIVSTLKRRFARQLSFTALVLLLVLPLHAENLYFKANQQKSTVTLSVEGTPNPISIEVKEPGGDWRDYVLDETIQLYDIDDRAEFRAKGSNSTFSKDSLNYYYFIVSGSVSAGGQLGSILTKSINEGNYCTVPDFAFVKLFSHCDVLTSAPKLPASLAKGAYMYAFEHCSNLEDAPVGLQTDYYNYAIECFYGMFWGCSNLKTCLAYSLQDPAKACCDSMYVDCTSLTEIPDFPKSTLADQCYAYMFRGCTGIIHAPVLPSTSLNTNCYRGMFWGCSNLEGAPALPAKTMRANCYRDMFHDCNTLETAPVLPATSLVSSCYREMFRGCSSLNSLTVNFTNWSSGANTYYWMYGVASTGTFVAPSGLSPSIGPSYIAKGWVKTLQASKPDYFYIQPTNNGRISVNQYIDGVKQDNVTYMPLLYSKDGGNTWSELSNNNSCSIKKDEKTYIKAAGSSGKLNSANEYFVITVSVDQEWWGDRKPGTWITGGNIISLIDPTCVMTEVPDYAFYHLFDGADNLTSAVGMPFTTLGKSCYSYMFHDCTALTTAPALPSIYLSESCYEGMFQGCTALKNAPALPAANLAKRCYAYMFDGCSSLAWMKVGFTAWDKTITETSPTYLWVQNVPVTGTFIKPSTLSGTYDASHIPLRNENKWSAFPNRLCFTALTANAKVRLVKVGDPDPLKQLNGIGINFNKEGNTATDWKTLRNVGDKLYVYTGTGANQNMSFSKDSWNYYRFEVQGEVEASGTIMSLLDQNCNSTTLDQVAEFSHLFYNCDGLKKAPELTATTLSGYCYEFMFEDCDGLTEAPELPAQALTYNCYYRMFKDCHNLTYSPDLKATIYDDHTNSCYELMFENCTSLVTAPALLSPTVNFNCYQGMFKGCTALKNAPELPALNLWNSCYKGMFENCSSLEIAPELPSDLVTKPVWNAYDDMFKGCTSLKYLNVGFSDWGPNTNDWVSGFNTLGTFVCPYELAQNHKEYGASRIPWDADDKNKQWSVIYDYLCFTAEVAGSVKLTKSKSFTDSGYSIEYYCEKEDKQWHSYDIGAEKELAVGEKIYFRNNKVNGTLSLSADNYYKFVMTGKMKASGKVLSLLNVNCQEREIPAYAFTHLFDGCGSLTTAPTMPRIQSALNKGCYSYMYSNCSLLKKAPTLPATELATACYDHMFYGCKNLESAPDLLATELAANCYNSMFQNCQWLTSAPSLPATRLVDGCYNNLFNGCKRLKWIGVEFSEWEDNCTTDWVKNVSNSGTFESAGISVLEYGSSRIPKDSDHPWTMVYNTLCFTAEESNATISLEQIGTAYAINLVWSRNNVYWDAYTIGDVITMTSAGDKVYFRATTVNSKFSKDGNNYYHFAITKKVAASGNIMTLLSADGSTTTVPDNTFRNLFLDCTTLTNGPSLPASILGSDGYRAMFNGCTNLVLPPALPALTLGARCYYQMFYGCKNLEIAPALPATTVISQCYYEMFRGCTSLSVAPELPATATESQCYYRMFYGCSKLKYIKVGFENWRDNNDTYDWVYGVAKEGTFVCPEQLPITYCTSNTEKNAHKIPYDLTYMWNVVNPFYLTANTAGSTVCLTTFGRPNEVDLQYSTNGITWRTYTIGTTLTMASIGDKVYFRAASDAQDNHFSNNENNYYTFQMTGSVAAKGNVSLLLDASGKRTSLPDFAFVGLFKDCTSLTSAPALSATQMSNYCYANMFENCSGLTLAPRLSATDLAPRCYFAMFKGCTGLIDAPYLPAEKLLNFCYANMFEGCDHLKSISVEFDKWKVDDLNATTDWVKGVDTKEGYFMKPSNLENISGDSYIPALWNTVPQYLCFVAETAGATVQFIAHNNDNEVFSVDAKNGPAGSHKLDDNAFEYSLNGYTWDDYHFAGTSDGSNFGDGDVKTLANIGDRIYFRNKVNSTPEHINRLTKHINQTKDSFGINAVVNKSNSSLYYFKMTGRIAGSGNIISLLERDCMRDENNDAHKLGCYEFCNLFYQCTSLTVAPKLPEQDLLKSGTAAQYDRSTFCYMALFSGCTNLRYSPTLPKHVNAAGSLHKLFYNCTSLQKAPELPATELAPECYNQMFFNCASMEEGPSILPATVLPDANGTTGLGGCYQGMFRNCTKLKKAPVLPISVIGNACYNQMFQDCTSLEYIEVGFTDWKENQKYCSVWSNDPVIGPTQNWVSSWGDTESKGLFLCPADLNASKTGIKFVPKGWVVVNSKIGTIPDEEGLLPDDYVFTAPSSTLMPTVETLDDEEYAAYSQYEKTVFACKDNGGTPYDLTFTTPHYSKVVAIVVEGTTSAESAGTIGVTGASLYSNSLSGNALAAGTDSPSKSIFVTDEQEYGGSVTFNISNGLYAEVTLYGEEKSHYKKPKLSFDYKNNRLTITKQEGDEDGVIYYSTSSEITWENCRNYKKYNESKGIDCSKWVNEATKYSSLTYYAVVANPDPESKKVASVCNSIKIYRIPQRCGYCMVNPGDVKGLKDALAYARYTSSENHPIKIFLPNGTYDFGTTNGTAVYDYVSLIGESKEGTIITGNGTGILLSIKGQHVYAQDLTIQKTDNKSYSLRDHGTDNIYYNCNFKAYRHAYSSSSDNPQRNYLVRCNVSAPTNVVWGDGDIWFEQCHFDLTGGSATSYVSSETTKLVNRYGHVFNNCVIDNAKKNFYLSYPSSNSPAASWMNLTITGDVKTRGYYPNSNGLFLRYYDNARKNWSADYRIPYENVTSVFSEYADYGWQVWDPTIDATQSEDVLEALLSGNELAFNTTSAEGIYLVESTDEHGDSDYKITDSKYLLIKDDLTGRTVTIRPANARGGFGDPIAAITPSGATAPISLNSSGYATFSSDQQVMIVGATAYIGKIIDDKIIFTRINRRDVVPANTGVLLCGKPGSSFVTYPFNESGFSVDPESNDWLPCVGQDRTFAELETINGCAGHDCHYYVLKGNEFVLRQPSQGGGIRAGKAYLHSESSVASGAPSLRVFFGWDDEEETAIQQIGLSADDDELRYNLSGQKTSLQKGLLIRDGKVVLVR